MQAIILMDRTTISLRLKPPSFAICNCSFSYGISEVYSEAFIALLLLLHMQKIISAKQPLLVITRGIWPRKKRREKGRLASWSILSAVPATVLPAMIPNTRAKAFSESNPTALPQGQNKLSTYGITFSKQRKMCILSLQTPSIILYALRPLPPICQHLRDAGKHPAAKNIQALYCFHCFL